MTRTRQVLAQLAMVVAVAACAADAPPASGQDMDLSDAEVAHVAVTANAIDADLARLALERSNTEAVRAFARTMVEDHTGVNEQATALVTKLNVTPAPNAVSASLQEGADEAKARLSRLSGAEFDRAYMTREVEYHAAVLSALDDLLIPTSENAELVALLRTVRPAIAAHLERARAIRGTLDQ